MKRVAAIVGPTGVGKSDVSLELAQRWDAEIVSVDSMQLYRGMDVGTAKLARAEMRGITHYMIDVADPGEDFSVSRYADMASETVDGILARGKTALLVGGTGLYLRALADGMSFSGEGGDAKKRAELQAYADENGSAALHERLRAIDPATAERLHPNDVRRVIRAIELYEQTGHTMSEHVELTKKLPPRYDADYIGLTVSDRAELYARIDARVDRMMAAGLEDEVRGLLRAGIPPDCTAMQAIGYKELASALRGERTLAEAVEDIKRESRRYAKRQLTWFRADARVKWIVTDGKSVPEIADECEKLVNATRNS